MNQNPLGSTPEFLDRPCCQVNADAKAAGPEAIVRTAVGKASISESRITDSGGPAGIVTRDLNQGERCLAYNRYLRCRVC